MFTRSISSNKLEKSFKKSSNAIVGIGVPKTPKINGMNRYGERENGRN